MTAIAIPKGRDFKDLASFETIIIGDATYPWTLITLGKNFLKLIKDQYGLWSIVFEKEFNHDFGSYVSKADAIRSLRDYGEKNGLALQIEYLSDDGQSQMKENPYAL